MKLKDSIAKSSKKHDSKVLGVLYTLLPEVNLFLNTALNTTYGGRFWTAFAYSDPSLKDEDRIDFVNANAKFESAAREDKLEKRQFTQKNISFLRFLNPIKPFYVGLEFVKSAIGGAIDSAFKSNLEKQSKNAWRAKLAVQILLLPIELPIIVTNRLFDGILSGVSYIKNKLVKFATNKNSQNKKETQGSDEITLEMEEAKNTKATKVQENQEAVEISKLQTNSYTNTKEVEKGILQSNSIQASDNPSTTQYINGKLKETTVSKTISADGNKNVPKESEKPSAPPEIKQPAVFNRLANASPSFVNNILKPHQETVRDNLKKRSNKI